MTKDTPQRVIQYDRAFVYKTGIYRKQPFVAYNECILLGIAAKTRGVNYDDRFDECRWQAFGDARELIKNNDGVFPIRYLVSIACAPMQDKTDKTFDGFVRKNALQEIVNLYSRDAEGNLRVKPDYKDLDWALQELRAFGKTNPFPYSAEVAQYLDQASESVHSAMQKDKEPLHPSSHNKKKLSWVRGFIKDLLQG